MFTDGLAALVGAIKSVPLIALPIMSGGMGAGAVPLSKIFECTGTSCAAPIGSFKKS